MEVQRGLILTSSSSNPCSTDSEATTTFSHEQQQQSTIDPKAVAAEKKAGPGFFWTFSRMLTPAPRPASATAHERERNPTTTTSSKRLFSTSTQLVPHGRSRSEFGELSEGAAADDGMERNPLEKSCSELESWPDLQDVLSHCLKFSPTDRPSVRSAGY